MAENNTSEKLALQFESLSTHAGLKRSKNEVKDIPIYASSSFVFNDSAHGAAIFNGTAEAFCYSRIGNPTLDVFEKRMAALEGGEGALATASGEAALFVTITALAERGSNIVVASHISEASTHQFSHRLPSLGIAARFVESGNKSEVLSSFDENTKALFVESISLRNLQIADTTSLATIAHEKGVPLIVDNTHGAGGYLIRPIAHGADIVLQSATPWISISGNNLGGVIVDSGNFPWETYPSRYPQFSEPSAGFHGLRVSEKFGKLAFVVFARIAIMRDIGPCLNPFEAAMLLTGLETLAVRMEKASRNAEALAEWLRKNEKVIGVTCPGFASEDSKSLQRKNMTQGYGGLIIFTLGEKTNMEAIISRLKLVSQGTSIGGSRTLLIQVTGVEEGTCHSNSRFYISVGLENIDDIINDFEQALT